MNTAQAKLRRQEELEDLRFVMETPQGRSFLWRLLSDARIFAPCYTGNSETFYREGKREFALKYFNDVLEACPGLYHKMVQENTRKAEPHGE